MFIPLGSGMYLSTSRSDAEQLLESSSIRVATQDECVQALQLIPTHEISASPLGYQALAVAIARHEVYVGNNSAFQSL